MPRNFMTQRGSKLKGEPAWILWFYLSAGKEVEDFLVKYHYIPVTDADTPASPGQGDTPTPPGGDDTPTSPGGDDTPTSPGGDDTPTPPGGDDTPTSPGGDDTPTSPGGDDTPTPPTPPDLPSNEQGGPSGAAAGLTLEAAKRRIVAGETALAPVWLINADDVANLNFELRYDASVARPDGEIQRGDFLAGAIMRSNVGTDGLVRVGFARATGLAGTGALVLIPFRAVGEPGSRTPLTLAVTTINAADGEAPAIALIHGEIEIVGPDELVAGDCDGDGVLTEADAVCALEISVGLRPFDANVDMDGNREVTSRDAAIILQQTIEAVK